MDEYLILVEPGHELPEVGKIMHANSSLYGDGEVFAVKSIDGLKWNKKGHLIVTVTASEVRRKYRHS